MMKRYLAKLVFRICNEKEHTDGQFDEQLRLIEACSQNEAYKKATALGKENEDRFDDTGSGRVKWLFVGVTDVGEMPEWKDGAELYYHIRETPDAEQYTRYILHRSALLSHQL